VAAADRLVRNAIAERIWVPLIPKAARDLRRTRQRSGLSVVDVVNRALSLYEFIDARMAAGDQVLIRRRDTGGVELVRFT
jgi:hypothetical protein